MSTTEQMRLDALHRLELMDTAPESEFNDLVNLASDLCQTPISLLTLLDERRQWFKAARGTDARETERAHAFCHHTLLQDDIFVVNDATKDPRFSNNPLVTGEFAIRFYAGALIHSPEGAKLGTLCIIDTQPRELNWREASILEKLARQATAMIELRSRRRADARRAAEQQQQQALLETHCARIARLAYLSGLQQSNMAAFIDNGMDALRTPRFTKKDIADINARAALHRSQIDAFSESLSCFVNSGTSAPTPIPVADLCAGVLQDVAVQIRERGCRLTPLIPADLSLRQDAAVAALILRNGLRVVLASVERTEISFLAQQRPGGIEFGILLPEQNLVDNLQRYLADEPVPGTEYLTGKPFHAELALTRDLAGMLGGSISTQRLGNRGSSLTIFLPDQNPASESA